MVDYSVLDKALTSVQASPATLQFLRDLHAQALAEDPFISTAQPLTAALDKFVALDPDKCALVYLLLRSSGARFVVEAGTSFGVSTIYLALAVGQNARLQGAAGKVIATENEAHKASKARENWKTAGGEVEPWIELREGDLRETLKTDLPEQVDFVLLDSKFSPRPAYSASRAHLIRASSLDSSSSAGTLSCQVPPQGWSDDCCRQFCCRRDGLQGTERLSRRS